MKYSIFFLFYFLSLTVTAQYKHTVMPGGIGNGYGGFRTADTVNIVKDYGADSTGVADATTAIQSAINYAAGRGGAVIFFPKGTYKIGGAIQTNDLAGHSVDSAQIYIPFLAYSGIANMAAIKLVGEVAPSPYNDWSAGQANPIRGVVLKSTSTSIGGAVFGAAYGANTWGNWTFHELFMENLTVKVRSKTSGGTDTAATMTALNASKISMLDLRDCRFVTESYQGTSVQPMAGTYGIKGPGNNNFNNTQYTNLMIQGFYTGLQASEHVDAKNVSISTCYNGVEFIFGYHASYFSKLKIWWCVNNLLVSGAHQGKIDGLDVEDWTAATIAKPGFGSKWWNNTWDIYEPANTGSNLEVHYHRVIGGVGVDQTNFSKSVLSNIRPVSIAGGYYRVSTVPATATSTGIAGTIAFDANYVYYCVATNTWVRHALTTW